MAIFNHMMKNNHEQLALYADPTVKLRAMLAVHSTALGPALGGVRVYKYKTFEEAQIDVLRLSQALTYKTAAAGVNFGGGQIVVIQQDEMGPKEPFFRALGRFIDSLKGRFIAGEDVGVDDNAMEYMAMETPYLADYSTEFGGFDNVYHNCAYGTFKGLLAAAKYRWGSDDIEGKKILLQGYGNIGRQLAAFLEDKGAKVMVADIDPRKIEAAEEDGYGIVGADSLMNDRYDIIAPCAVSAAITPEAAQSIQCDIIAGAANNQLLDPDDCAVLKKRNILYAPDFIINAGAIIVLSEEYLGYKEERAKRKIEGIYDRALEIFATAEKNDITTHEAAIRFAMRRIDSIKKIKGTSKGKLKL